MEQTFVEQWGYWLIGSAVILLIVLGYVALLVKKSRVKPSSVATGHAEGQSTATGQEAAWSSQGGDTPVSQLQHTFAQAIMRLKSHVTGRNYRYDIPWYLLVGEVASGKSTIVSQTDLHLPFGPPSQNSFRSQKITDWWFFDQGIVLDTIGDCVLRSDGLTSDERGWKSLLHQLVKHRPQRPIDGIILTIPCRDLLLATSEDSEVRARIKNKAAAIYKKLCQAQHLLGMNFPVYVIISQCDALPGFRSFGQHLPARLRQEIVGWSNPYTLETAFSTDWIDQAFESLQHDLCQVQVEMFAVAEHESEGRDELFMFPREFLNMKDQLGIYLTQLFKESVYHETFFLRGMYFCGDVQDNPLEMTSALEGGPQKVGEHLANPSSKSVPQIAFLKHLFERRIFPEHALAKPAKQSVFAKNRFVLAAQCFMIVLLVGGGYGLWHAYQDLIRDKTILMPMLTEIRQDLSGLQSGTSTAIGSEALKYSTKDLLQFMSKMQSSQLRSFFMPTSWFAFLDAGMSEVLTIAYNHIILKSVAESLQQKTEDVLRGEGLSQNGRERVPMGTSIQEIAEFTQWSDYINSIVQLQDVVTRYNTLQQFGNDNLEDFGHVVEYLFPGTMTPEFYQYSEIYRKALAKAALSPIELEVYREKATAVAWEYSLRLFNRIFEHNQVLLMLQDASSKLEAIQHGSSSARTRQSLQELVQTLESLELIFNSPQGQWLVRETFHVGGGYTQSLMLVETSDLLGAKLANEIKQIGEQGFQKLKSELEKFGSQARVALLDQEDVQFGFQLSEQVARTKAILEKILAQPFLQDEPLITPDWTHHGHFSRLVWNHALLQNALQLADEYHEFAEKEFPSFPVAVGRGVRETALQELNRKMTDRVYRAVTVQSAAHIGLEHRLEEEIRSELNNFREVQALLEKMLLTLDQLGFEDLYWDLSEMVARQSHDLLRRVEQLGDSESWYALRGQDLSWWDGQAPLAYGAYEIQSRLGLQTYIESQRARVRYVTQEYAKPLVEFLGTTNVMGSERSAEQILTSKWQSLLLAFEQYDKKKPDNSIAKLEAFLANDLNAISVSTCLSKTAELSKQEDSIEDYFTKTQSALVSRIHARCQTLAGKHLTQGYTTVEQFFNGRLAGKFPFASFGKTTRQADPSDLRAFFGLFDAYFESGASQLDRIVWLGPSGKQADQFVQRMADVKMFFSTYLADSQPLAVPMFQLELEFRTNREREIGGNQVMTWHMTIGDQHLMLDATQPYAKARWALGDSIEVGFRWAKNAPSHPVSTSDESMKVLRGDRVTFTYPDAWSLLTLLARHHASSTDFPRFVDPRPHTLKFVIPMVTEDTTKSPQVSSVSLNDGVSAEANHAELFIRVVVKPIGGTTDVEMPWFPNIAPPLDSIPAENSTQS